LASGLRVSADDVKRIPSGSLRNEINSLRVSREGRFTYVTLKMTNQVSYRVTNRSESERTISFNFQNTSSAPGNQKFDSGMFSQATWDKGTLKLHFRRGNAFWGYEAVYQSNNTLVLKFRHNPGSMERARIAIDAGHGGRDRGAPGRNPDFHEVDINRRVAQDLARELKDRGATVIIIGGNSSSPNRRRERAENWNADILVSIHTNSAPNKNAAGTETYFFNGFNRGLATGVSRNVSRALATNNRGAKNNHFNITLSTQMRSILVETGFMSNQNEYAKLIKRSNQRAIAKSIADALEASF